MRRGREGESERVKETVSSASSDERGPDALPFFFFSLTTALLAKLLQRDYDRPRPPPTVSAPTSGLAATSLTRPTAYVDHDPTSTIIVISIHAYRSYSHPHFSGNDNCDGSGEIMWRANTTKQDLTGWLCPSFEIRISIRIYSFLSYYLSLPLLHTLLLSRSCFVQKKQFWSFLLSHFSVFHSLLDVLVLFYVSRLRSTLATVCDMCSVCTCEHCTHLYVEHTVHCMCVVAVG